MLAGNDEAHPFAISEEMAKLLPNSEFIKEWKEGAALTSARVRFVAPNAAMSGDQVWPNADTVTFTSDEDVGEGPKVVPAKAIPPFARGAAASRENIVPRRWYSWGLT